MFMKNLFLSAVAALATLTAFATGGEVTRYRVNVESSSVTWNATKVTGAHNGTVSVLNGTLSATDGQLTAANVIVDMQSIACSDLDGEWGAKLVGHLASEDFFHTSEHKTSSFTLRAFTPTSNDTYTVEGDFTIRGITKSVTFEAKVAVNGNVMSIDGDVVLDRSEFDVKYGSGSFFDDLGDNLIHDEFTVGFHLEAVAN